MSIYLNNASVQEFDNVVKDLFQGKCMLKNFVDTRMNVVGSSYNFVNRTIVEAQQRGAYGAVAPQVNPNYNRPPATLLPWVWQTPTDLFEQTLVNFDEIGSLSMAVADALGRRTDKIIVNGCVEGTTDPLFPTANAIPVNYQATGNTNLTFAKILAILQRCDAIGVPYQDVTLAISAAGLQALLTDDHFTNIFYTDSKPLASGSLRNYLGMNIVTLPDNNNLPPDGTAFNGSLPLTGTVRTAFAFHKRAVGYAESMLTTRVDYSPQQVSYLTTGMIMAGAVTVDPTGLISIAYDESVTPT